MKKIICILIVIYLIGCAKEKVVIPKPISTTDKDTTIITIPSIPDPGGDPLGPQTKFMNPNEKDIKIN